MIKEKKISDIRKALRFMIEAHSGSYRKFSGLEYAHHPVEVAQIVRSHKRSKNIEKIIIASLCHDLIEDTNTTLDTIEELFGEMVSGLVDELTSDPNEIRRLGKTKYLTQKMLKMTSYSLLIKLSDRKHNCSDLKKGTEKFRNGYVLETRTIIESLKVGRYLSNPHKELISEIETSIVPFEK